MSTKTIAVLGDSQSDWNAGYGVDGFMAWPKLLREALVASGAPVRGRGFGTSGDTTTQMLARADALQYYDTPAIAIIYGGVNDPGASITQATTQANLQAMCKSVKHGAVGAGFGTGVSVAGQASLPAGGELGQRFVVMSDTSATGGAVGWHGSHAITKTGNVGGSSGQSVWENRFPLAGEPGWGRVADDTTAPTTGTKIVLVSTNYLNWTTNGDQTGTPYAAYAPLRTAAAAAVTAENIAVGGAPTVVYTDLYGFQRARILAGTDPNFYGSSYVQATSWHVCDYPTNNAAAQHHSAYGHQLVVAAILNGGPAGTALPAAWLASLLT